LDKRVARARSAPPPAAYSFQFWQQYVAACRRLAEQANVDGRTLD
jgi:hypothetical protein